MEKDKSGAYFRLIGNMLHDFRAPVSNVRGYAQLLLVTPPKGLTSLSEVQAQYVQNLNLVAERLQKSQDFFQLALRAVQQLYEPPPKERVVLAEVEVLQKQTISDLNLLSPIHASKQVAATLIDLLNFMKSDELEVRIEDDENWVRFSFSNFTNPTYWLERNVNKETNRLSYDLSFDNK